LRFDPPPLIGRFVRRYKRFFADVELPGGEVVTAHCPNTGRMTGCLVEGAPALVQPADGPRRKLRYTWIAIRLGRSWVGLHTGYAPVLVAEAIRRGVVKELAGYERLVPEVRYGARGRSRIDLLLSRGGRLPEGAEPGPRVLFEGDERVYVEVKNTTLTEDVGGRRVGAFPDAVTERGRKHLEELMHVRARGHRAALVFTLQRNDCVALRPADAIDPAYGRTLREAAAAGVELYALGAHIGPAQVRLVKRLPVEL
jgi:sugar fermentation stimulation protein A